MVEVPTCEILFKSDHNGKFQTFGGGEMESGNLSYEIRQGNQLI